MSLVSVALRPLHSDEDEHRNGGAAASSRAVALRSADRRRNPDGPKTQIKELRSRHQAILRLDLAGLTQREIAPIVGLTPQMICVVQNSDIYRAEHARLQGRLTEDTVTDLGTVSRKLESLCGVSVDTIEEVLLDRSASPKVRADTAFNVLDRNGLRPPERHEHVHTYDSVLLDAYRRRREAAATTIEATAGAPSAPPGFPGNGPDDENEDEDGDADADGAGESSEHGGEGQA